jgi:hypothetical protein
MDFNGSESGKWFPKGCAYCRQSPLRVGVCLHAENCKELIILEQVQTISAIFARRAVGVPPAVGARRRAGHGALFSILHSPENLLTELAQ